jgi:hypothetical protein
MHKALGLSISAAAIIATGLVPAAAWAATTTNAAATSSTPADGDPNTTVTFTVTSGALTMTAPASTNLGSGAPGTTVTGALGPVTVTDDRGLLTAAWTVTASSTSFTTGGGTPAETIPAGDLGYSPGSITTTGTIMVTGTPITLSNEAAPVVTGTDGVGNNTASWDPAIAVAIPAAAVSGTYVGTITQSVS